jgi:ABC-2 type transport system permease protein
MICWTLLKTTARKNWPLLLVFFAVLSFYMTIMISMFDPDDMEAITSMLDLFPEDLMKAMGFSTMVSSLTTYLASWLYGLLMFGFPMVYCIILGNRLVAKMVDNGSFACLLSTPNSRAKIILSQGIYALASILFLFSALSGTGVLIASVIHPGLLDITAFLRLNITTMLVNQVVMMISFFFSCLFNETKLSSSFSAGIPITFLLMNMLGGVSPEASIIRKFSIYGLYDPVALADGAAVWIINISYAVIAMLLFAGGVLIFNKKRLPI